MTVVLLLSIIELVLSADGGTTIKVDKRLIDGLSAAAIGKNFYPLTVDRRTTRIESVSGRIATIEDFTSTITLSEPAKIMPGYSGEFEIPEDRIPPAGVFSVAQSRLHEEKFDHAWRCLKRIQEIAPEKRNG